MGEEFMRSSLCIWLCRTFEELTPPKNQYNLSDGEFLNKVMATICPARFTMSRVHREVGDDTKGRIENLNTLLKNLICCYEEAHNSLHVAHLPDIRVLGSEPQSYASATELEKIFTLILGIAFQCDNRQLYIQLAQQLPEDIQKEIMVKITHLENSVVIPSFIDPEPLEKSEVDGKCRSLLAFLKSLVLERNDLHEQFIRVSQERDEYLAVQNARTGRRSTISMHDSFAESLDSSRSATPAYATEMSELRAKLIKAEEEIESKTEAITRLREDNESSKEQVNRLKKEYRTLYDDAQSARIYRDEIDALRSKAEKLDKYEVDISKYRDKLEDMEYLRNRVKELKNGNDQLVEMNDLLKEELMNSEQISKALIAEEEKNIKLRSLLDELSAQKEYGDRLIADLTNKKKQVELELKHSSNMVTQMQTEIDELTASNNEIRMLLREKDEGAVDSKFMTVASELSYDNGQTPIVNRRRSTIKDGGLDEGTLDMLSSRVKRLEMENVHLKTQTETLKNSNAKLQILEENTGKDKLVIGTNKAEITRLQEEINLEKQKSEGVLNRLSEAHRVLKEIGYDPEKLNEAAPVSDREKFLQYEERLKQSLNLSLSMKEERIAVLEERVKENTDQNDSLRQELSIIKRQNKSFQKQNKSLQQSLDSSVVNISSSSPVKRISRGVQYEHHVSLSSTPIKQPRLSTTASPAKPDADLDISAIRRNNENKSPNSSRILNVSYDSISLTESGATLALLKQDCIDLKDENDRLFVDKERLEQEVEELQTERRHHLTELERLRQRNMEKNDEIEKLERECRKQVLELEEFEIACKALEDMNEKLKSTVEQIESEKSYTNAQCNKLLMQNQELLIKTIEDQEKNREETRVYQDQIMNMKQDNQQLAMNLAMKAQNSEQKKKPFYKNLFKSSKKVKSRDDPQMQMLGATPHIDEYLEGLSNAGSVDRLTLPDSYDSNGYYQREFFVDSDTSSRTMSGDGRGERDGRVERGSVHSLGRVDTTSNRSENFRCAGISRTMSTDCERRSVDKETTPKRHGSLRLKTKSDSFDLTPRVEPRTMARPIPPGTHGTPDSLARGAPGAVGAGPGVQGPVPPPPRSSHSVRSSSASTTATHPRDTSLQGGQIVSEPPSAFRQYNSNTSIPSSLSGRGINASSSSVPFYSEPDFRPRSTNSSVTGSYARGLHDEDTANSSYYEYGCV